MKLLLGIFPAPAGPPFTVNVPVPHHVPIGSLSIVALALDAGGVLLGDSIAVSLEQSSSPNALQVQPAEIILAPGGPPQQLLVSGRFFWPASAPGVSPDGRAWKDVTDGSHGTVYSLRGSNNVVTVSSNGLIAAIGEGVETIEVRYRGLPLCR